MDAVNASRLRSRLAAKAESAASAIAEFAQAGPCYVSCSWGKDSTVLAHIIASRAMRLPLVWVRVVPVENPDCPLVRDAFIARWAVDYHEIKVDYDRKARRTSLPGFQEAARRFGDRYVSGVRGAESRTRSLRMASVGISSARTCAPIGHWSTAEVFAYLYTHDLPIHPAYAQSAGGMYDREWLRVGALGGERGRGHGRRDWEQRYYPIELHAALAAIG